MSDVRDRLKKCFSVVFPELQPGEIDRASPSSVANWDSMATVTLFSLIEEEFGVPPADDLAAGISFATLALSLEEQLGGG